MLPIDHCSCFAISPKGNAFAGEMARIIRPCQCRIVFASSIISCLDFWIHFLEFDRDRGPPRSDAVGSRTAAAFSISAAAPSRGGPLG